MTVLELFTDCEVKSELRVLSGYNGKVLCYKFNPAKHLEIGKRNVTAVWADITVTGFGFGNYAQPIMCVYVNGSAEYEKEMRQIKERVNNG